MGEAITEKTAHADACKRRVARIGPTFQEYVRQSGMSAEDDTFWDKPTGIGLACLLADIMHWFDAHPDDSQTFDDCLALAREYHFQETEGGE